MAAGQTKDWERWNTHFSVIVEQDVFGHTFKLAQDPNSQHLGTTVWDSSIVLAKYLEKNARKGDFARHKMKGKRAVELGAGMGLGGLAFAMLGCDVLLTDVAAVLPLLQRNYENNLSPSALRAMDSSWSGNVGAVAVRELDWAVPAQAEAAAAGGPFEFVVAADCVYHEQIVEDFLRTVLTITDHRSTVMVVNELRSESVHARFLALFEEHFTIKKAPRSKMDAVHQHPAIDIFLMKRKRQKAPPREAAADEGTATAAAAAAGGAAAEAGECAATAAGGTEAGECAVTTAAVGGADGVEVAAAAAGEGAQAGAREPIEQPEAQPARDAVEVTAGVDAAPDGDTAAASPGPSGPDQCSTGPGSSGKDMGGGGDRAPEGGPSPVEGAEQGVSGQEECNSELPGSDSNGRTSGSVVSAWETRRQGAAAARLLRDVSIS